MTQQKPSLSAACSSTRSDIVPTDSDPAAIETWLEDQARDGWQLRGFSGRFFRTAGVFERSDPRPTRYRLTPMPRREAKPSLEQRELCEHAGWQYVASLSHHFHIWRCDRPDAPEMETDPVTQAEGYRYLRGRLWREFGTTLVLVFLMTALLFVPGGRQPLLTLLESQAPGGAVWLCFISISAIAGAIQNIRVIRKLYRRLHTGIPMDRPARYRGKLVRQWTVWVLLVLGYFYILFAKSPLQLDEFRFVDPDSPEASRVRYVDLADLSPVEPDFIWMERKTSELAPEMGRVRQSAALSPDGSSQIWASTRYFRVIARPLARELVRELKETPPDQKARPGVPEYAAVPPQTLDEFWWAEDGTAQYAVVRKGWSVLALCYGGPADLRQKADVLAGALT